ncbi:MAG: flavin reductase family protein [Actinobacteria bacterium]|jgi:flavin reductase ActVB|nr:flavin reductase family protein [Actinomycetota bacterium]
MSSAARSTVAPLAPDAFKAVMRTWATGVAVVTSRTAEGEVAARTANSFTSLSQSPPLVSWCPDVDSVSYDTHATAEVFGVSILAADQVELCWHFASSGGDKFAGVVTTQGPLGTPLIAGAAAHIECHVWARYPGGDHLIVVGEVQHLQKHHDNVLVMVEGRPSETSAAAASSVSASSHKDSSHKEPS